MQPEQQQTGFYKDQTHNPLTFTVDRHFPANLTKFELFQCLDMQSYYWETFAAVSSANITKNTKGCYTFDIFIS